jgi:ABC-type lipoprotein export system ATPase subunit
MLSKPRQQLAHEQTGNLDEENGQTVLAHLADFARQGGAVLLVTHDVRAADFASRVVDLGRVAAVAGATS